MSRSPQSSPSQLPHQRFDDVFFVDKLITFRRRAPISRWWFPRSLASSKFESSFEELQDACHEQFQRIEKVEKVYWCTEPLNEVGALKDVISPRTLPRILADRKGRGLIGPATWEVGHSYALVKVKFYEGIDSDSGQSKMYRLNWGQGRKSGTNLTIREQCLIPEAKITGERLEDHWNGNCSGDQLYSFLKKWDGREYDAAPSNNRNCHHFVQELLEQCTSEHGYDFGDR